MGSVLSRLRQYGRRALIRAVLRILSLVSAPMRQMLQRLAVSPGIPVDHPCPSYWMSPPSPIAKHGSGPGETIPGYADVVIIGSGITGTSIARTLLDEDEQHRGPSQRPLQVVMLEARDACSGATGRNGGHITPVLYQDYAGLKKTYGPQIAAEIIRFRLAHLTELLTVAREEDLLTESQCRETRSYDVYQDAHLYRCAKELLEEYKRDLPEEGAEFQVIEDEEGLKELEMVPSVVGCLASRGGAVHPYRLVTGILARLLRCYETRFQLFTHTPCTDIEAPTSGHSLYTVCTPKGKVQTEHVVHATNGWASHLLPGLRGKIVPARGVMTAQASKRSWEGKRSFVLFPESTFDTYDYLTQQQEPGGEMMLGGGFMKHDYLTEIGNADDSRWNSEVSEYLSQALGLYFETEKEENTMLGQWGGILGVSIDKRPWVGRVPENASHRKVTESKGDKIGLSAPGEWIAAGYSGEGMVHAWLSGKAVARMLVGGSGSIPEVFTVNGERVVRASVEAYVG